MLPPFMSNLFQEDQQKITAYTATDAYQDIIAKIVSKLDKFFIDRVSELTVHAASEDAVQVDMEHILSKFFEPFYSNLATIQGKDEFSDIVAGDIIAGLVNLGHNAQKVTRYNIGADNLYSNILIKHPTV